MLHIHLVRMPPSNRLQRHPAPAQEEMATKSGNQQLWYVTIIIDQRISALQYVIPRRRHGQQVNKVPGHAPHITTEYSADIINMDVTGQGKSPRPETEASSKRGK